MAAIDPKRLNHTCRRYQIFFRIYSLLTNQNFKNRKKLTCLKLLHFLCEFKPHSFCEPGLGN